MAYKPMRINNSLPKPPSLNCMINVSPIFDVMTGEYVDGVQGEKILNGGLYSLAAIVGEGNTFKSTIMNSCALRVMSRHPFVTVSTYDTEGSFSYQRMNGLSKQYPSLANEDFTGHDPDARYSLSSVLTLPGDDWWEKVKTFGREKKKVKDALGTTPFKDTYGKNEKDKVKYHYPSIFLLDSLSEFQTTEMKKKMESNDIDSSNLNMYYAQAGLQKSRFVDEIGKIIPTFGGIMMTTAHVGSFMSQSPTPEKKQLNYLKQGHKIKKVPQSFQFMTFHCWNLQDSKVLYNSDRSGPLFPSPDVGDEGSKTDIYAVTFVGLRNKSGLSGIPVSLIVSQSQGVLFDLSHYYHITTRDIGVEKAGHGYKVIIYPDVTALRTNVRQKLKDDPRFARAVELTCEIALMYQIHDSLDNKYRLKFNDIYTTIRDKGYDWNKILDSRGYWLFEEEVAELSPPPYLSGLDLLRICVGEYEPKHFKRDSIVDVAKKKK